MPGRDERIVRALLDAAYETHDPALAGRALRRLRSLSTVRNRELEGAADPRTVAARLAAADPRLRARAVPEAASHAHAAPAPIAPAAGREVARVAARAAALGLPARRASGRASEGECALAHALLALSRDAFLAVAREIGRRELRWLCGMLDRQSALRLLARLGAPTRALLADAPAPSVDPGDLEEACARLASVDLAAAGCDTAVLLGCSRLFGLVSGCEPSIVAAIRSRMPLAFPATDRPEGEQLEAALAGALEIVGGAR